MFAFSANFVVIKLKRLIFENRTSYLQVSYHNKPAKNANYLQKMTVWFVERKLRRCHPTISRRLLCIAESRTMAQVVHA